jgi:hypothetical protein
LRIGGPFLQLRIRNYERKNILLTKKIFMKKNLLLMMLCCPVMLAAQNGVTVSNLAVNAGTVTFNVQWTNDHAPGFLWSDTVWVFVDYNNAGKMERLPLLPGATLTATSPGGKVIEEPDNNKGVWVAGNARTQGAFSATVKLLTAVKDIGGACVYDSNYQPVGEYKNNSTEISFTGTPEYKVVLERSDKSTYTATVGKDESLSIPSGEIVLSFTDATGAPGRLNCIPPSAYTLSGADVCLGADVTLTLSSSESGWHYQLYKDNMPVGSEKEGTGSALTFSEVSIAAGKFNYMVRTVDATGAQCEIAVSNVLAIMINPVSAIYRNGGNASQTVHQNTAITAMAYTASNAATIAMTGDFPTGINGVASGSSYTISGTPTVIGTFRYSLTPAVGSCSSTSAEGILTVIDPTQPIAASTQTWTFGAQTWSDRIVATPADCIQIDALSMTDFFAAEYRVYYDRVYYKSYCMTAAQAALCPNPWRVPSRDDMLSLKATVTAVDLMLSWGFGGYINPAGEHAVYSGGWWMSTMPANQPWVYYIRYDNGGGYNVAGTTSLNAVQLRCVK